MTGEGEQEGDEQPKTDLHVPQELEDLHGPEDNVLDRLLSDATQRGRVDIPCRLGLLQLQLWRRWRRRLPAKGRH